MSGVRFGLLLYSFFINSHIISTFILPGSCLLPLVVRFCLHFALSSFLIAHFCLCFALLLLAISSCHSFLLAFSVVGPISSCHSFLLAFSVVGPISSCHSFLLAFSVVGTIYLLSCL